MRNRDKKEQVDSDHYFILFFRYAYTEEETINLNMDASQKIEN